MDLEGSEKRSNKNNQNELNDCLLRFQAAFELMQRTDNDEFKKYYFETMGKELDLLDNMAKHLDLKKIRNQEHVLSKDARAYMLDQSSENFEKLRQDITTLKEANKAFKSFNL